MTLNPFEERIALSLRSVPVPRWVEGPGGFFVPRVKEFEVSVPGKKAIALEQVSVYFCEVFVYMHRTTNDEEGDLLRRISRI